MLNVAMKNFHNFKIQRQSIFTLFRSVNAVQNFLKKVATIAKVKISHRRTISSPETSFNSTGHRKKY